MCLDGGGNPREKVLVSWAQGRGSSYVSAVPPNKPPVDVDVVCPNENWSRDKSMLFTSESRVTLRGDSERS